MQERPQYKEVFDEYLFKEKIDTASKDLLEAVQDRNTEREKDAKRRLTLIWDIKMTLEAMINDGRQAGKYLDQYKSYGENTDADQ